MARVKKGFHLIYPYRFDVPQGLEINHREQWGSRSFRALLKACKFTGVVKLKDKYDEYTMVKRKKEGKPVISNGTEFYYMNGDVVKQSKVKYTSQYYKRLDAGATDLPA